jgi:hypothetical protein
MSAWALYLCSALCLSRNYDLRVTLVGIQGVHFSEMNIRWGVPYCGWAASFWDEYEFAVGVLYASPLYLYASFCLGTLYNLGVRSAGVQV